MKDIYLSYTQQTFQLAQHLKVDIESQSNLLIGLENDDWEDEGNDSSGEFQEHLDSAKAMLVLMTESGNITAWIIDPDFSEIQPGFQRPRDISLPPRIDFTESYEKGLDVFRYILKVVTGSGDIEMEPEHERYAIKEERTVSSKQSSRKAPRKGLTSPVKKFQCIIRRMGSTFKTFHFRITSHLKSMNNS